MTADPVNDCTDTAKDCPWNSTPSSAWRDAVDSWNWQSLGEDDWEKSGSCPRCHHEVSVSKVGSYMATFSMREIDELEMMVRGQEGPIEVKDGEKRRFFARCDCGEKHPGRPLDLTQGCGQWAFIEPPPEHA